MQSADGAKFPAVSFNATVWPAGQQPTTTNAEIVRVTTISTDTFTITRAQESSSARTIVVGDQIAATVTAKTLTDVEGYINGTTAPTFLTPALGTPASGVMTNVTGLPNAGLSTAAGEIGAAWAAWTPTWTNLTVGNGTVTAKYLKIGKFIQFSIKVVFGSTTTIGGDVDFTFPVATVAAYVPTVYGAIGTGSVNDNSAGSDMREVKATWNSTTVGHIVLLATAAAYGVYTGLSSTVPFTWAVNDSIFVSGFYEAA